MVMEAVTHSSFHSASPDLAHLFGWADAAILSKE